MLRNHEDAKMINLVDEAERLRGFIVAIRDQVHTATNDEIEAICERALRPTA
jgi:hypothetical protein